MKFVVFAKNHADGNGNLIINFSWPKIVCRIVVNLNLLLSKFAMWMLQVLIVCFDMSNTLYMAKRSVYTVPQTEFTSKGRWLQCSPH